MWLFRLRKMFRVAGRDALVLFFAIRDPRTPRALKLAAGAALAWILSPIDPLPDLPLIGWVDDMLVLSVALPLLIRRLPEAVRLEANLRADRFTAVWWPARATGASVDGMPAEVLDPEPGRVVRAKRAARSSVERAAAAAVVAGSVVAAAAKAAARTRGKAAEKTVEEKAGKAAANTAGKTAGKTAGMPVRKASGKSPPAPAPAPAPGKRAGAPVGGPRAARKRAAQ